MNKTLLAIALTASVGTAGAATDTMTSATFTMLDGTGGGVGLDTTVTGSIGDGAWSVASTTAFFGQNWTAHGGTTFGPGTYSFDTVEGGIYTGVEVGAGQVGGHILFDWGVTADIDVVNVWDVVESSIPSPTTILKTYTSTDVTATNPVGPDGIRGLGMIDGAFIDFNANFDFTFQTADVAPPVITLIGGDTSVVVGTTYTDLGANCVDAAPQQTEVTFLTINDSAADTSTIGTSFTVVFDCTDTNGNPATTVTRTVTVVDQNAVTTLLEAAPGITTPIDFECANTVDTYVDAGARCEDPQDGSWTSDDGIPPAPPLPAGLDLTGVPFDETTPGVAHNVTWTCTDTDLNTGTAIRVVNVVDTLTPVPGPFTQNDPVSSLSDSVMTLEVNDEVAYANLNPTLESVSDSCDTTVPALVMTADTVDFAIVSGELLKTSILNYTTTDASGNVMIAPLTVNVYLSEPVITMVGDNLILNVGDAYIEPGIDIFDAQDGSISGVTTSGVITPTTAGTDPASPRDLTVTIDSSAVNTAVEGAYEVTYDVTDFDGNTAAQVTRTVTVGVFASGSNFTMLDAQGNVFGGTNDVIFDWDQSENTAETDLNFNMSISSQQPFPFFGFVWTAHDVRVFGPGTYSFDTGCTVTEIRATGCPAGSAANSGPTITMTVPAGMVGAHILFDWNTTDNIDVVNVWEIGGVWDQHGDTDPKNQLYNGLAGEAPDPLTTWKLVSTDINGDFINGSPMVDGPFQGFYANFNAGPGGTAPPPEPYTGTAPDTKLGSGLASISVWALSAGLLTIFGFRRFRNK